MMSCKASRRAVETGGKKSAAPIASVRSPLSHWAPPKIWQKLQPARIKKSKQLGVCRPYEHRKLMNRGRGSELARAGDLTRHTGRVGGDPLAGGD
eukprot:6190564-Pleurochrysis_carterae.AAC.1